MRLKTVKCIAIIEDDTREAYNTLFNLVKNHNIKSNSIEIFSDYESFFEFTLTANRIQFDLVICNVIIKDSMMNGIDFLKRIYKSVRLNEQINKLVFRTEITDPSLPRLLNQHDLNNKIESVVNKTSQSYHITE